MGQASQVLSRPSSDGGEASAHDYRADYHVHTASSHDAVTSLAQIVEGASRMKLDCVAITDHGTVEGALALVETAPPWLEVLVGCEYDTDDGAQVIGLGVERVLPERRLLPLLESIRAEGGLTMLPHPFRRGGGAFAAARRRSPAFVEEVLALTDLLECHNGHDRPEHNTASLALAQERMLAAVAGSDAHAGDEIGSVFVEYTTSEHDHGRSPRAIWFADRGARPESTGRRRVMEAYHALEPRLPKSVANGYRGLRRRLALDRRRSDPGPPRSQYELGQVWPSVSGP